MNELKFKPKYQIMAEKIRNDIVSGKLTPGERLKPDTELAKEFEINKRTVARGMEQLVAGGLISRTPGRGSVVVRPNVVSRKSDAVGVVERCNGDVFSKIEQEVTRQTLKKGFYPLWVPQSLFNDAVKIPDYRPFRQFLEHFINDCPYGMLVHGERFIPFDLLERNLSKVGKLVFINDYLYHRRLPADYVLIDYRKAAEKAVRHLYENNHRRITFIASPIHTPVTEAGPPPQKIFCNELCRQADKFGMSFNKTVPEKIWVGEKMENLIRGNFADGQITAAVLGFDALWFNYYRQSFHKAGIEVPEDLSLIGFFNTPHCTATDLKLTSIDIHEREIAKVATELLFEKKSANREIFIEPELIIRNSVKKL